MYLRNFLNTHDRAQVVEFRALSLGPPVKAAQVHLDLAFGRDFDVRPVHRTRCGTFEVDAFGIVAGTVTRAFELVLARLPVGCASQVRADRRDDEDAFGIAHHPDPVLVLKFGIDPETEVRRITDQKLGLRLEERSQKEEPQEHQKIHAQEAQYACHHEAAAARDRLLRVRIIGRENIPKRTCNSRLGLAFRRVSPRRRFNSRIRHVVPQTGRAGPPSYKLRTSRPRTARGRRNREQQASLCRLWKAWFSKSYFTYEYVNAKSLVRPPSVRFEILPG